jgi:hypothetical protein
MVPASALATVNELTAAELEYRRNASVVPEITPCQNQTGKLPSAATRGG